MTEPVPQPPEDPGHILTEEDWDAVQRARAAHVEELREAGLLAEDYEP